MKGRMAFALSLACGCARGPAVTDERSTSMEPGEVARVADLPITEALVRDVARARAVSPGQAMQLLVDDALAAKAAERQRLNLEPAVAFALRSARARATLARLRNDALAAGLPTNDEVAELSARHWRDVALPEQRIVVHAVVLRPDPPVAVERARGVAAQWAALLPAASDAADFETRANRVSHEGLTMRVERLPPFVKDGRVAAPGGGMFEQGFAAGAFALDAPGATSGVVETRYGWHVIRLLERLPPRELPLEQRRAMLAAEIYAERAHRALDALLSTARARMAIIVEPSAGASMDALMLVER